MQIKPSFHRIAQSKIYSFTGTPVVNLKMEQFLHSCMEDRKKKTKEKHGIGRKIFSKKRKTPFLDNEQDSRMSAYLLLFGMRPFSSSFPILTASQFPSLPSYRVSTTLKISPLVKAKLCGDSFSHSKWLLMKNESPLPQAMMSLYTKKGTPFSL